MTRRLPPFAAVRAFEAAARHRSFKAAGEELCLSASAVSHQIRALENYLDTALFERRGNQMHLTLTGRAYSGKLTDLLNDLDTSTRAVKPAKDRPFRVLSTPGFAARWLVPRLDKLPFADRVRLRVSVGAPSTDFTSNDADVVIQWADGPTPQVEVIPLMESSRYPVASPDLCRKAGISAPQDLLSARLMYDETDDAWSEWFQAAGLEVTDMPLGPTYPNCELATTAAEQGQGISLAYDAVVRSTIDSGRLIRLFDTVTMPRVIYSIAYQKARASDPMIQGFCKWIFDEAAATLPAGNLYTKAS